LPCHRQSWFYIYFKGWGNRSKVTCSRSQARWSVKCIHRILRSVDDKLGQPPSISVWTGQVCWCWTSIHVNLSLLSRRAGHRNCPNET
jgi:hypothetical protein